MVGDLRGLARGGAGGQGQGEEGDGGIAGAGDVEDFLGAGGGVVGGFSGAEEHHALLAEGDEEDFAGPFFEQNPAHLRTASSFSTGSTGSLWGRPGGGEGLGAVRLHDRGAVPLQRVVRVGVDGEELAGGADAGGDFIGEALLDEALAVILDDDGIEVAAASPRWRRGAVELGLGGLEFALAIHADDLLVAGDDAGLDDGVVIGILLDGLNVDAFVGEEALEGVRVGVGPDHAENGGVGGEFAEVAGDVGGAAGVLGLAVHLDHGDGGFRRDAADAAPDELIEDEIADDQDAGCSEVGGNLLVTCAVHKSSVTAAKRSGIMNS